MATKRKPERKATPAKRKKNITRNRPKRPGVVFVRLFEHEEKALRTVARREPLATFVRNAALAYVATMSGKREEDK